MSSTTIDAPLTQSAQSWPAALARTMRRGIAGIGSRRRLRRHIEALAALDDRTLGDIGLSRGEIRQKVGIKNEVCTAAVRALLDDKKLVECERPHGSPYPKVWTPHRARERAGQRAAADAKRMGETA